MKSRIEGKAAWRKIAKRVAVWAGSSELGRRWIGEAARKVAKWLRLPVGGGQRLSGLALLLAAAGGAGLGQTQVDLRTQAKSVDFSGSASTKPAKTGSSLPGTCTMGEVFFLTTAPAGQNLYGCAATNTWVVQASGGVAAGAAGTVLTSNGSSTQWTALNGDVQGSAGAVTVKGLQSRPVATTAPQNGQALVWNGTTWTPQTVPGGSGSLTAESGGTVVGSRPVWNFVPGTGTLQVLSDTGSKIQIQQAVDTAVIQTRSLAQGGQTLLCESAGGSANAYTCAMTPTLMEYRAGMVVNWRPDVTAGAGGVTLNIDTLGAKTVKLADGVADATGGELKAGGLYPVWYDGAHFRLVGATSVTSQGTAADQPACSAANRGRLWLTPGTAGLKDTVAVCVKSATDTFVWAVLY